MNAKRIIDRMKQRTARISAAVPVIEPQFRERPEITLVSCRESMRSRYYDGFSDLNASCRYPNRMFSLFGPGFIRIRKKHKRTARKPRHKDHRPRLIWG